VVLPGGVAHGFASLVDDSLVSYSADKAYMTELDTGININSFGYDWKIERPILSNRDCELIDFASFISPFDEKN
jgi:dTDP-4-dehydrorhamnose 3,5-epimerase-like enzyme